MHAHCWHLPTPSSWPGLTQPSISKKGFYPRAMDARVKPGHDEVSLTAPYSQDQVEKSFSNCGTSFQTPFSFLLVMVINCGWNRKPATASVASMRWASPSSLARPASSGVVTMDL